MIFINRTKAEAIALDRIRIERDARLASLDVSSIRALESGRDLEEVAAQKTALREVTSKDLSLLTLDQLAALTLDQLLEIDA